MLQFYRTWNEDGARDGSDRRTLFYDIREHREVDPADYRADAEHLLGLIASGAVVPTRAEILPLTAAANAHRRVAAGGLQGRLVLQP